MNSRPASHMDTMEGGGGAAREGSGRPSAGPFATESEAESEPFEAGEEVTLPLPPTPTPTPTLRASAGGVGLVGSEDRRSA